jgi:hypothetical protein
MPHDATLERSLPIRVVDTGSPQDDDPRTPQEGTAPCVSQGVGTGRCCSIWAPCGG